MADILTILHHLRRAGHGAEVHWHGASATLHTAAGVYHYDRSALRALALEAPTWQAGQSLTAILW